MSHSTDKAPACRVIGSEKLPAEIGGSEALCAAIEKAVRETAPDARYTVELRVLSAYALAATVRIGDGTALPDRRLDSSDRPMNSGAIDRFAASIAAEIAKSAEQ